MKKSKKAYRAFSLSFLVLITIGVIFACQSVSEKDKVTALARPDAVSPPVKIEAGDFIVNNLDTLPPPKIVKLSDTPPPAQTAAGFYVTMQNFNTEDGLALSSLLSGYKDKAGNLWFGTSGNGVSMYNGKSFTNYSSAHGLIHNLISTITEDHNGNMWFGTYGGVSKYNGIFFENFTTEHGLINNDVRKIVEDKRGNIWFASVNGLSRYSPSQKDSAQISFVNYTAEDGLIAGSVISILEDRNGNLWFGGSGGISKYNPATKTGKAKVFQDWSEPMGVEGETVNTITEDKDGIIWVGTDELLSRYDPAKEGLSKKAFTHITVADGLADNRVLSSLADRRGNLWFGTYGGGLSKYNGQSVIEYSSEQGLPGKAIYAITEDRKGNLWFAPLDGGIVEYRPSGPEKTGGTFVNYTAEQGFNGTTAYTSVEDSNGNLWFGTSSALFKYDGTSFTAYTTEQGLPDDYINALYTDREGNLWIGTFDGGVSKFDGKSFTNFSTDQGLVHKTVWNFLEDKNGIIWIATRGGLSRFDGTQFMNFTTDQGLPDNKLSTIMQDSGGNILTAGWGGGVSIIRKRQVDKLGRPDAGQKHENIFEHFSTAEGLANDVVYNILEDGNGNLIIGTSHGFTILKGGIHTEEGKIAKDGIENYNEETGYPIKDVSHIYSLYKDSSGFIWAGTGDKLVRFDYGSVHRNNKPLTISLQSVEINNEHIPWHSLDLTRKKNHPDKQKAKNVSPYVINELRIFGRTLTSSERDTLADRFRNVRFDGIQPFSATPENLVLPYAKNNLSFDFVGVETARPHLVRYRYKLEGNDEDWSPVTDKATATFGNIFEGSYTFMVQAQSPDGVWSEPLRYSFTILPPWWRTWWAYLFYIFVFMGGLYMVHRVQKARTIRNEQEKTQQRELEQAKKIKKAYRELEIEAALERVRSRSMAMRHTSELQEVVNAVSQQLQSINVDINGGVFIMINSEIDNAEDAIIWGSGGAADYVQKAAIPFLDRPIFTRLRDAVRKREDFLVEHYSREEKIEFFKHLFKHPPWNDTPRERKKQLLSLPGDYARSLTISSHTSLFIINNTGKPFSDKDNDILKRFGKVFEQSYIRFLDLKKAEAQAKEAMRQAALDRVRGEISSMRSTDDMQQIIPVVWRELTALGVPFFRCGVCIIDEEQSNIRIYLSAPDGHLLAVMNLGFRANPFTMHIVEHWRKSTVYTEHWDREDFIRWTQSMTGQGQIGHEKAYPGAEKPPESLDLHLIPFKQGMLYVGNKEPLTADEIDLSKSLAEAFSMAYARYQDFTKLEAAKQNVEAALSDLEAAQQQLVQQEKLASLGQLTAGIAHEIKNPLNFVNNFSEVSMELIEEVREELNRQLVNGGHQSSEVEVQKSKVEGRTSSLDGVRLAEDGDAREQPKNTDIAYALAILNDIEINLGKIHEHGHRADRIVKSMLQHSRGGSGRMEPVNLNALVKEFVNLAFHGMRAGKNPINVDIELDLDEAVGEVSLIAEDFSRVLVNLCNNAFDAMREKQEAGGSRQKAVSYLPKLMVRTIKADDQIIIEIEDNGPGIPEGIKDKILQPFFTTKKGTDGTGLGLSITNDIVEAHGGHINIKSQAGESTTFLITIPTQSKQK